MSLLNKFFEFSDENTVMPEVIPAEEVMSVESYEMENAQVPTVIGDELVEMTYSENGLSDLSRSIFAVEKFMNTLPKELPAEIKKTTVSGILQASNISVAEVCNDGLDRLQLLEAVDGKISNENKRKVEECTQRIAQLNEQIEALNKEIYDANNEATHSNTIITKEMNKINELIKFINGGI